MNKHYKPINHYKVLVIAMEPASGLEAVAAILCTIMEMDAALAGSSLATLGSKR